MGDPVLRLCRGDFHFRSAKPLRRRVLRAKPRRNSALWLPRPSETRCPRIRVRPDLLAAISVVCATACGAACETLAASQSTACPQPLPVQPSASSAVFLGDSAGKQWHTSRRLLRQKLAIVSHQVLRRRRWSKTVSARRRAAAASWARSAPVRHHGDNRLGQRGGDRRAGRAGRRPTPAGRISGVPPTSVATIATPAAAASSSTRPSGSCRAGCTSSVNSFSSRSTSSRTPRKWNRPANGRRPRRAESASNRRDSSLSEWRSPTISVVERPAAGRPASRAARAQHVLPLAQPDLADRADQRRLGRQAQVRGGDSRSRGRGRNCSRSTPL